MHETHVQLRQQAEQLVRQGAWDAACALLEAAPGALSAEGELVTLYTEALLHLGRIRDAYRALREAQPLLAETAHRAVQRNAQNLLGAATFELGLLDEAEAAFTAAAEMGRADGDLALVARATGNLGAIANIRGRPENALLLYELAIPAYQRVGSTRGLAASYHNMAISFRDLGQLKLADEYEQRAIEFAREAGSWPFLALARLGRAELSLRNGDFALAEVGARHAISLFRETSDPLGEADALQLAGRACTRLGRLAVARTDLERALRLARDHGNTLTEAESLRALADLALANEDLPGGRVAALAAAALFDGLGAIERAAEARAWPDLRD